MGTTSEAMSPAPTVTFMPVLARWPVSPRRARILVHDVHKVFGEAVAVRLDVEEDLEIVGATTDVLAAVAIASRVCSSSTVRILSVRPSVVWSFTKS